MKTNDKYGEIRIERIMFKNEKDFHDFLLYFFEVYINNIDYQNNKKYVKRKNIDTFSGDENNQGKERLFDFFSLEQRRNFKTLRMSIVFDKLDSHDKVKPFDARKDNERPYMVFSIKGVGLQSKIQALKAYIAELYDENIIISYYDWPSYEGDENRATDKNWILEQHNRVKHFNNGVFDMVLPKKVDSHMDYLKETKYQKAKR